jgi:YfiH family protein
MDNNFLHYKIFAPYRNLMAFTTTRMTVSHKAPRFTGDFPELYMPSRTELADKLNINTRQMVFPRQSHTCTVADVTKIPPNEPEETDALVTAQKGICLCIQTADCVPVLLFDPHNNVIAAVHAGWKGTVKKITEIAVRKMVDLYECLPGNILALIGPSIGPAVYEVGDEVAKQVVGHIPGAPQTLSKNSLGKYHFNLWKANHNILISCGLTPDHIEISGNCSFTGAEHFFSARRDGTDTGRMVSGIMLIN